MKRIQGLLAAFLIVLTLLWWLADTLWPQPFGYFSLRRAFMQYSGVVAIGAMSLALLLALRPRRIERPLGGLDKMYRLHKWLGITALVVGLLHWWWAQGTKWMVGWGWLERPARRPRAALPEGSLEAWLGAQRGLAEGIGEWAFYAALLLLVLALVKRFPYHWFRRTHKWIALAYLALVYHAIVLTQYAYWRQPIGWLLALLLLGGSVAALLALAGRIGAGRSVSGHVEAFQHYPTLEVSELRVALQGGWPGHAAGQFAFVTTDAREGAHPFTIASAWDAGDPRISFIAKALGDHTARLRGQLAVGLPVQVEGPYGCFDFEDDAARQIWVGAGIGITPFVARMKQLATQPGRQTIDLFHPTGVLEPAAIDKLRADAQAAGVRLHLLVSGRDARLDAESLCRAVPDWAQASVWFCGPADFGRSLGAELQRCGLPARRFHQELFEMR